MSTIRHPYWTKYWTRGQALHAWESQVLMHKFQRIQDMLHLVWACEINKEAVQLLKYKLQQRQNPTVKVTEHASRSMLALFILLKK